MSGWKKWRRAEIMILRQCAGTMTVESIGSLIGRSEAAVRAKAWDKGISLMLRGDFHPSAKYSQRDIELARQLHQRGVPRREIAEKFGMKLRTVNNYVYFDRRVQA
ncbi:DNA-binding protein [Escherichia coli]|nr:DNA-binding protein [Escherichia coli]